MPDYTTNFHLKKPLPEDPYNIADANDNMDLLDAAVHTGDAALSGHLQDAAPHNATATATASKIVVRDANGRAAFATPAAAGDAATKGYVDGLSIAYGVTTNSGNAYSVTTTPVVGSLTDGLGVAFKCNADSTAAVTLNVCGKGAKPVMNPDGTACTDLKSGIIYSVRYEGTGGNFILQGKGGMSGADLTSLISSVNSVLSL